MVLLGLGINYRSCPINLREQCALAGQEQADALMTLKAAGADEALVLSTCNRTELFCGTDNPKKLIRWLAEHPRFLPEILPHAYRHQGSAMVHHVLRTACGLDSMILGEAQILGQMKNAFALALDTGLIGRHLGRLFPFAFSVAKQIRHETGINQHALSVPYAAVQLVRHIFADMTTLRAVIIGAGEMARLSILNLVAQGVNEIVLINRTRARAQNLCLELTRLLKEKMPNYRIMSLAELPDAVMHSDLIITAVGAPVPLIGKGLIERALKNRKHKPQCIIDLGLPRDVEHEVASLGDAYLYCIDDLKNLVEHNKTIRQEAAHQAEQLITTRAQEFLQWLRAQQHVQVLREFRHKHSALRDKLLDSSLQDLARGRAPERVLQQLAHQLTAQFLHQPSVRLRQAGFEDDQTVLALAQDFFDLNG